MQGDKEDLLRHFKAAEEAIKGLEKKRNIGKAREEIERSHKDLKSSAPDETPKFKQYIESIERNVSKKSSLGLWDFAIILVKQNPLLGFAFGILALYPIVIGLVTDVRGIYIIGCYIVLVIAVLLFLIALKPGKRGEIVMDEYTAAKQVLLHYDKDCSLKETPKINMKYRGFEVVLREPSGKDLTFYISFDGRIL
ncbi:hypothetical protein M1N46_03500, partial [Dehalococcoidia bacterium]|nr:hypothetical protein [Dehalococcoidia bacterium]